MKSQLDESVRSDHVRLNVTLKDVPCGIDNVDAMDDYRNLVILQPGTATMAREAATAMLVSRFYFVLGSLPDSTSNVPTWYHGTIKCKGSVRPVLAALQKLQPENLDYVTDSSPLGRFGGTDDLCAACGRYCQSVSIPVRHLDDVVNIYLRKDKKKRWRISGFPDTMASFIDRQNLRCSFGRSDHGRPHTRHCHTCDNIEGSVRGKGRKRTPVTSSGDRAQKRARRLIQG